MRPLPIRVNLRTTPVETEEQRLLERYYQEFNSSAAPGGGIFLEDRVYSRTLDPEFADPLSIAVAEEVRDRPDSDSDSDSAINIVTEIAGTSYRVYIAPLHSESVLNRAYQLRNYEVTDRGTIISTLVSASANLHVS